ncbi:hypothetical protein ACFYOF_18085 [Streptomyces sp. NPDC007148]|uniref:hypothetical protein n=1 Tax=Streptomyces sp. NPDC007148 TaxID=3364775 RepID=UPI00369EF48E
MSVSSSSASIGRKTVIVGLAVYLALGGDQAGIGHRGEQVDLGAVDPTGSAHGLAVHGE